MNYSSKSTAHFHHCSIYGNRGTCWMGYNSYIHGRFIMQPCTLGWLAGWQLPSSFFSWRQFALNARSANCSLQYLTFTNSFSKNERFYLFNFSIKTRMQVPHTTTGNLQVWPIRKLREFLTVRGPSRCDLIKQDNRDAFITFSPIPCRNSTLHLNLFLA